eukprot:Ihof_evm2s451 gene=Ihof_evmTU2s451
MVKKSVLSTDGAVSQQVSRIKVEKKDEGGPVYNFQVSVHVYSMPAFVPPAALITP